MAVMAIADTAKFDISASRNGVLSVRGACNRRPNRQARRVGLSMCPRGPRGRAATIEPWRFYRDLLLCPVRVHRWRGVRWPPWSRWHKPPTPRALPSRPSARDWLDLRAASGHRLAYVDRRIPPPRPSAGLVLVALAVVIGGCQSGTTLKAVGASHRHGAERIHARALEARARGRREGRRGVPGGRHRRWRCSGRRRSARTTASSRWRSSKASSARA